MKQAKYFSIEYIENTPYLLPYGQSVVDQRRHIRLNETSLFLWNQLENDLSEKELLNRMIEYYEADEEDIPYFKEDLSNFLETLKAMNLIENNEISDKPSLFLKIADIVISLASDDRFKFTEFIPFITDKQKEDLKITIKTSKPITRNGNILIRNKEVMVMDLDDSYTVVFPSSDYIYECHLSKISSKEETAEAFIYVRNEINDKCEYDVFHAIRHIFLYVARFYGLYAVHSCSFLYKDSAWLVSGHAGMGKSTHVSLWHKLFNTEILNGDVNLLGFKDNTVIVYGLPWCGTSSISTNKNYPLAGIILITQDTSDHLIPLKEDEKILKIAQRMITPVWIKDDLKNNLEAAEKIKNHSIILYYGCTKEDSAAITLKKHIDTVI